MTVGPTPLSDMIMRASKGGRSYGQLEQRAIDPETGASVGHSQLQKLARGHVKRIPDIGHLAAIAAALDVPCETVWLAAVLQWMPPRSERLLALLVGEFEALHAERAISIADADVPRVRRARKSA